MSEVEEIAKYFHYAKENAWVNNHDYQTSFVFKHRLAYIVNERDEDAETKVKIAINFPLLPRVLKTYLHKQLTSNVDCKVDITKYSAVQGYYMEAEFFTHTCLDVVIVLNKDSPEQDDSAGGCHGDTTVLVFPGYIIKHQEKVLDEMATNTLYELRINHPVIDVVGLIKDQIGTEWLVFIQISKQPYTKHSPCLADLFKINEGISVYDELSSNTQSLFTYYCFLAGVDPEDSSKILYVYVSTSTYYDNNCDVFNKMQDHAANKCYVGLLSKQSNLYNTFIRYQYM